MADENTQAPANDGLEVTQQGGTTKVQADGTTPLPSDEAPKGDRPEGLPEGFDSWEAYGKAQLAKEAEAGDTNEEAPKEGALDAETQAEVNKALETLPQENQEKARPFFESFATKGDLTSDERDAAAKAFGVSREMVDQYVAGWAAQNAAASDPIYEAGGGREKVDAFTAWAEANYTPEQKAAYNEALGKDPIKAVKDAVALWEADGNGAAPASEVRNNQGTRYAPPKGDVYGSVEEMTRDQADPRYAKDPAFRKQVEEKIGRSNFDGLVRSY